MQEWQRKTFRRDTTTNNNNNYTRFVLCLVILALHTASAREQHSSRFSFAPLLSKSTNTSLLLSIRAGANTQLSTSQKRITTTTTTRQQQRKKTIGHDTVSSPPAVLIEKESVELPTIQALLVPRTIQLTFLLRLVSIVALAVSFIACLTTAGRPYRAAVLLKVYGRNHHHDDDNNNSYYSSPHERMIPTALDQVLAFHLANASGDTLPPRHLPSTKSLLSFLISLALWIAATLFPTWFVSLNVRMNYRPYRNDDYNNKNNNDLDVSPLSDQLKRGDVVMALVQIPREERHLERNGESHVLCPLHATTTASEMTSRRPCYYYYFELHHRRFYYDHTNGTIMDGGPNLHTYKPLCSLIQEQGLTSRSRLRLAQECFRPYNSLTLPTPSVWNIFCSRISSPLVVLQLIGRLLGTALLENDFKSSMFGIMTLLCHHYLNARRSIVSATELAQEVQDNVQESSNIMAWARRPPTKGWKEICAKELLPGDVFVLSSNHTNKNNNNNMAMPVDALLLDGACITNEAVLTGESVAQTKVPLEVNDDKDKSELLDMQGTHRNSILFAGTTLLHCSSRQQQTAMGHVIGESDPLEATTTAAGPRFLALRTGSYSSRGELVRALARSHGHVGAISNPQTERDALRLIASLSCFAALACISLIVGFSHHHSDCSPPSAFRLVMQCTRIAVSSIPSDLPLALSAVAHSCLLQLRKEADVVCSEPGSLLTAAHVTIVVFDKTGTLTADTQALSHLVTPPKKVSPQSKKMSEVVLAGCHSLMDLGNTATQSGEHGVPNFVGDPLDRASLQYVGWTYNRTLDAFEKKQPKKIKSCDVPVRLWQIKTFAFDANRQTSCALLLVEHANGCCRLWKVIKGSPDVIQSIVKQNDELSQWYKKQRQKLGGQGYRTIAMVSSDVTCDTDLVRDLFPKGIPNPASLSTKERSCVLLHARNAAGTLHRSAFEEFGDDQEAILGFACFDAALRPSTRRVIHELQHAQVNVIMLTGDGVDAAISVADAAGLVSCDSVVVVEEDAARHNGSLVCRRMRRTNNHNGEKSMYESDDATSVTGRNIERMFVDADKGKCALVMTGKASERLLDKDSFDKLNARLRDNLFRFSVFARATPKQKRAIVSSLKGHGMKVLMCGDGVNDVAAMKVADVGVALLNGYGQEGSSDHDVEDERRRQHVLQRKLGSNRMRRSQTVSFATSGVGSSAMASSARIKAKYEKALRPIQVRALTRMQNKSEGNDVIQSNLQDVRDSLFAFFRVVKEERQRNKKIRRGGGDAARILAEEDKLRRELMKKHEKHNDTGDVDDGVISSTIKPGEASLAGSFSCLRPSIDGIEAILRVGVAAAACALTVQQTIALNCLLSCYNLASLYSSGFRYGRYHWNIELFLSMAIDQASYQAACTGRPRLSSLRPEQSLFNPKSALLVCSQAFVHLMTLTAGVRVANALEATYATGDTAKCSKVQWKGDGRLNRGHTSTFSTLAGALAAVPRSSDSDKKRGRGLDLLGRPPFRPNYTTNIVFLLSIFQNAVSAIITHKGSPFYLSVLESRQFCFSVGLALLCAVAGASETFPVANSLLELRSLPSRRFRRIFLAILVIDFVGCFSFKWVVQGCEERRNIDEESRNKSAVACRESAADTEEALLMEEAKSNRALLLVMSILALTAIGSAF